MIFVEISYERHVYFYENDVLIYEFVLNDEKCRYIGIFSHLRKEQEKSMMWTLPL